MRNRRRRQCGSQNLSHLRTQSPSRRRCAHQPVRNRPRPPAPRDRAVLSARQRLRADSLATRHSALSRPTASEQRVNERCCAAHSVAAQRIPRRSPAADAGRIPAAQWPSRVAHNSAAVQSHAETKPRAAQGPERRAASVAMQLPRTLGARPGSDALRSADPSCTQTTATCSAVASGGVPLFPSPSLASPLPFRPGRYDGQASTAATSCRQRITRTSATCPAPTRTAPPFEPGRVPCEV